MDENEEPPSFEEIIKLAQEVGVELAALVEMEEGGKIQERHLRRVVQVQDKMKKIGELVSELKEGDKMSKEELQRKMERLDHYEKEIRKAEWSKEKKKEYLEKIKFARERFRDRLSKIGDGSNVDIALRIVKILDDGLQKLTQDLENEEVFKQKHIYHLLYELYWVLWLMSPAFVRDSRELVTLGCIGESYWSFLF